MEKTFTLRLHAEIVADQTKLVCQCMEYDIVVQGDSMKEVIERFKHAVKGHILISKQLGEEPFTMLPKGGNFKVKWLEPIVADSFPIPSINAEAQLVYA